MNFADCLGTFVTAGDMSKQEAAELQRRYDALREQARRKGNGFADAAARDLLAQQLNAEKVLKKVRLALAIKTMKRIGADFAASKHDMGGAAINLLEHHGAEKFSSVEGRRMAIVGQAHARLEALLYEFRRSRTMGDNVTIAGKQFSFRMNQARLDNVVREAFGIDTKDEAAKGLFKSWSETTEWLRQKFNAGGGAIGKLENWGLPQSHDGQALINVGKEKWKTYITPLLDAGRMVNQLTGDALTPEELSGALDHVYDSITTEGWAEREPVMAPFGRGILAAQHAEQRFLVFKDPDAWLKYQRDFGEGDPFAAMMSHINRMAKDIASLEVLGPNPNAMLDFIKQSIRKQAAGDPKLTALAGKRIHRIEQIWDGMRGTLETPVNSRLASTIQGVRTFLTSVTMGSAIFPSVPGDLATSMVTRAFSGLPVARTGLDIAKQFAPAERRKAVAAGMILETAMHTFHRQARYVGSLGGPEFVRWLADRTLTWSGLTPWTIAARHAGGLGIMHELAEAADQSFEKMPAALAHTLANWGLEKEWDTIRATQLFDNGEGVMTLRASDVVKQNEATGLRYLEMINGEVEHMVPAGSVRSKTWLVTGRPGTLWGEISRSASQFKSFTALYMMLHTGRIAQMGGWRSAAGASYAVSLLIGTTLAGALGLQLSAIAGGRDPQNVLDARFWGQALLKGGGLGLFGDFLFADLNRYGGGFGRTLSGPSAQYLWDAWTLTGGNVMEAITSDHHRPKNFGRELTQFIGNSTPGSSIWYLRAGYQRLLIDQLQWLADPQANKNFKQRREWWKTNRGQDFFWQPGQAAPDRPPDFSAMLH